MNIYGQKMHVFNIETDELLIIMHGMCLPRKGEMLTIFNNETGVYNHYTIIKITHGTNMDTKQLVSSIHVKLYKSEKSKE